MLFAIAASAAFLANEPLLVLRGHRGRRMQDEHRRRAACRLAVTAAIAAAAGGFAIASASIVAAATAGVVAAPAALMFGLAWMRRERSWWGELVAAIALPAAGAPVMVASGVAWQSAMLVWVAWSIGFACSVIAVRRVISRHRKASTWRDSIVVLSFGVVTTLTAIAARDEPVYLASALLACFATLIAARPPSASRLRPIGVLLTVVAIAAGAMIVGVA
jgi:hypothetical protein